MVQRRAEYALNELATSHAGVSLRYSVPVFRVLKILVYQLMDVRAGRIIPMKQRIKTTLMDETRRKIEGLNSQLERTKTTLASVEKSYQHALQSPTSPVDQRRREDSVIRAFSFVSGWYPMCSSTFDHGLVLFPLGPGGPAGVKDVGAHFRCTGRPSTSRKDVSRDSKPSAKPTTGKNGFRKSAACGRTN